jgi:hypothetical protein
MGIGDNLGGLGENVNKMKDEHGDQINDAVDNAQEQHSDRLGEHAGKANEFVDGAQEQHLGGGQDNPEEQQQ